jgi:predicted HicB family RNase H-like nuclease
MKRVINGKTYNTDTATRVTGGDNQPYSDAWSALYQTRHGAFFRIIVDHDGMSEKITPLEDAEAQADLEEHANHLVEQYFGPMPEYGAAERRLTIRVPGNLAGRMEDAAKAKGLSLNSYAMRCFEQSVAQDGQPAGKR